MEKKYIMIGGNDPEMTKAVFESILEKAPEAVIYELDNTELLYLANRRIENVEGKAMVAYLEDERNKNQAKEIARQFFIRFEDEMKDGFVKVTEVKNATNFSWSKFNQIAATLDIFGLVGWKDSTKREMRILMTDEDIKSNKKREIQSHLDLVKGKLAEYQNSLKNKKEIDKIESLKKRLNL